MKPSILVCAALLGAPLAASATPAPPAITAPSTHATPAARPATTPAAASYADREAQSTEAAKFEGGRGAIYIGGGAVTVLLLVLLIVLVV